VEGDCTFDAKTRDKSSQNIHRQPADTGGASNYPEYLEKLMKLEASIDARIDKLLNRLVHLQECRRANEKRKIAPPKSSQD
jgi:hypothetical protein